MVRIAMLTILLKSMVIVTVVTNLLTGQEVRSEKRAFAFRSLTAAECTAIVSRRPAKLVRLSPKALKHSTVAAFCVERP
jgi:hypothetical protein